MSEACPHVKFCCVLFDLDGTVLNTVSDCAAAINRVMDDCGYPRHTDDEVRSYLNNGARRLLTRALPKTGNLCEDEIDVLLQRYLAYYSEECLRSSVIYDGVEHLLRALHARGVKLGIVTNKPDLQTKIMVPHYFGDLFGFYEGNSETVPTKPDPCRVSRALDALHAERDRTVFVGDSAVDTETARSGGIPCIGVAWGFGGPSAFDGHMPDRIVRDPMEILSIVEHGF